MSMLIPADWDVPSAIAKRLGDAAGRQRAMAADGHLLLVLHEVPTPGVLERTSRFFWRNPEGAWKAKPLGDGVQSIKRHVREFTERVDELDSLWQSASTAEDYYALLRAIAPLHRSIRNLLVTMQQARELVPSDRDLINLRDQAGEADRAVELLHADARNGLDFTIAHQVEQQTQKTYEMAVSSHRLNLLVATFFPVATLSAIFGMNLVHGLGWDSPTAFWGILIAGLCCGVALAKLVARPPKPIARSTAKGRGRRK